MGFNLIPSAGVCCCEAGSTVKEDNIGMICPRGPNPQSINSWPQCSELAKLSQTPEGGPGGKHQCFLITMIRFICEVGNMTR